MSSPGMVLLATATASNVTSVDFTSITSTYDEYEIHCINIIPKTDGIDLYIRTSSNGGSSFYSGASDYSWVMYESTVISDGTYSGSVYGDNAGQYIRITRNGVGNESGKYGYNGVIKLFKPSSTTVYKSFVFTGMYQSVSHVINHVHGAGQRLSSSAAVNAIRFLFSSGNISSGEFKLYGIIKSL